MNRRTDDVLAEGMVGLGLIIALVLALAGIWLIVQAIDLVVRQLATHPENKPLWIALGAWLLLTLLVIATHGRPAVLLPWVLSLLTLLLVARVVELYYDPHLQADEALVDQVLHQPWWGE